jgi:hypothetical protein
LPASFVALARVVSLRIDFIGALKAKTDCYVYKPRPPCSLEEIRADILAVEKETEGLLSKIIGGGE